MYYIACDALQHFETSDRVNAVISTMRHMAHTALFGQDSNKTDYGLTKKRDTLLADLKAVFAGISPQCLKVEAPAKRKLRFGNIYDDC
jgi:hypothetical protein